jgi:hypothetical protein
MKKRHLFTAFLVLCAAAVGGLVGNSFAAKQISEGTSPELVKTYDHLATAILGTKNAETAVVRAICAEAHDRAQAKLAAAADALAAGDGKAASQELEAAAGAVVLVANEGDHAVAAVRNRLLEGGHHHHATPEIAAKYDPGFVLVTKESKNALLAEAKAIGMMAGKVADLGGGDVRAAGTRLAEIYRKAVE